MEEMGAIDWDLMATWANVNRSSRGIPLLFFSRYFDAKSKGVNLFSQYLSQINNPFAPPEPVISMVLGFLVVKPFDNGAFTITHPTGKKST